MIATDALQRAWNDRVAQAAGPLPGYRALQIDERRHGRRLIVRVPPDLDIDVPAALPDVAQALNLPAERVWLGPEAPAPQLNGRTIPGREIIINNGDLLRAVIPLPQRLEAGSQEGRLPLGLMLDGGAAEWTLWEGGRACSGVIVGPRGCGARNALGLLAVLGRATGTAAAVFVDTGQGIPLPQALNTNNHHVIDAWRGSTVTVREIMAQRWQQQRDAQRTLWSPSPDRPVVMVIIDDAAKYFREISEKEREYWVKMIPQMGTYGVGLIARVADLSPPEFPAAYERGRAVPSCGPQLWASLGRQRNLLAMGPVSNLALEPVAPHLRRHNTGGWKIPAGVGRMADTMAPCRTYSVGLWFDGWDTVSHAVPDPAPYPDAPLSTIERDLLTRARPALRS